MNRLVFPAALLAGSLFYVAPMAAQVESGRVAALDYLGRGYGGLSCRGHRRGHPRLVRGDPFVPAQCHP